MIAADHELRLKGQPTRQECIDQSIEIHSFISPFPDLPNERGNSVKLGR